MGVAADWVFPRGDGGEIHECETVQPCAATWIAAAGAFRNCSVISRQDEFCIAAPPGSLVDDLENAREPYSVGGYFRLDLHDEETITCDPLHDHRDAYCYDFRPCAPNDACEGDDPGATRSCSTSLQHIGDDRLPV